MTTNTRILTQTCAFILAVWALSAQAAPASGEKAPDFTSQLANGKSINLESVDANVILVNFWASWCSPCQKEMPFFEELYQKYHQARLEIIAVSVDEDSKQAARFLDKVEHSFPTVLDVTHQVAMLYNPEAMPTTFVLDRQKRIKFIHKGFHKDDREAFPKEVEQLMQQTTNKGK